MEQYQTETRVFLDLSHHKEGGPDVGIRTGGMMKIKQKDFKSQGGKKRLNEQEENSSGDTRSKTVRCKAID